MGNRSNINLVGSTTQGYNLGGGAEVFKCKSDGNNLQFRTISSTGTSTCVIQSGDKIFISGSSGGDSLYTYESPSVHTVGGLISGTTLTGMTLGQILAEILIGPELCGTITAPSVGVGISVSGLYEAGCILSQTITGTFNRGCINPQYCSLSDKRSGLPNAYCFAGGGMPSGWQTCAISPASYTNTGYTISPFTQTLSACTRYDAGSPALGSRGTQYCAALASGSTSVAISSSIIGAYPLFATTVTITGLTKQTIQNMATANCVQINLVGESGGNKEKFDIPCAWLTCRPLVGICTSAFPWFYQGGTCATSLTYWTKSSASETVQGNTIGYCRYTYNSTDRGATCILLQF
jgi:hypothetical protein